MKKSRLSLPMGILALLLVTSLLTGCFRAAVPDATDTPSSAQQAGDEPEGTPDIMATGMAESTRVAETTEEPTAADTQPTEAPTAPPPTNTSVPPTATPSTTAVPTFTPAPSSPTPTPAPAGEVKHTVQAGENLFRIALRYGTTVEAVASANGIANPAMIYIGQVLTISSSGSQQPAPTGGATTYVVQPGDNLFRIALRYNMSYLTLAQHNNIANPASIYVGQVIRIP